MLLHDLHRKNLNIIIWAINFATIVNDLRSYEEEKLQFPWKNLLKIQFSLKNIQKYLQCKTNLSYLNLNF